MNGKGRPILSVVVPVYNELRTVEEILLKVQAVDIDKEILVVDDGSTDGTGEFLKELESVTRLNPGVMTLPQSPREIRCFGSLTW